MCGGGSVRVSVREEGVRHTDKFHFSLFFFFFSALGK